eukprot:3805730-Pleurochrysis_carterae.AAC.1
MAGKRAKPVAAKRAKLTGERANEELANRRASSGGRASLPLELRTTLPSITGDLRASACAYSVPTAYTCSSRSRRTRDHATKEVAHT